MLLAVDIGNSNIKFGVFDGKTLSSKHSIRTQRFLSADQPPLLNLDEDISASIVCSVVPEADDIVRRRVQEAAGVDPVWVSNEWDFGFKVDYEPPGSLGADRLVNAFAAVNKHGVPCIVCSLGTAVTIDVVTADRRFIGGLIAPGLEMLAKALPLNTSKLPEVKLELPERVIQRDTEGSIRSGIMNGYIAMIEGLVARSKNDFGKPAGVIGTGGSASFVSKNSSALDAIDENLLLDGLQLLYEIRQPA